MASKPYYPFRGMLLSRFIATVLIVATLPGCALTSKLEYDVRGEPLIYSEFLLTTSKDTYHITRRWNCNHCEKTLSIPKRDLPAGCQTARFFINTLSNELQIAQMTTAEGLEAEGPRMPDDSYPPCALLINFGTFAEPLEMESVAVTSNTGLIATSERKRFQPLMLALFPVAVIVDFFIVAGAVVTMPVWLPIGLVVENDSAKHEKELKDKEKSELPPPVSACWTAIDKEMEKNRVSTTYRNFVVFKWTPAVENAYKVTTVNGVFSDENPIPIDTRIALLQGSVEFKFKYFDWHSFSWTDADVECGLWGGDVVATSVILHK